MTSFNNTLTLNYSFLTVKLDNYGKRGEPLTGAKDTMNQAKITLIGIVNSLKNKKSHLELFIEEKFSKKTKGNKTWLEKNFVHRIEIKEKSQIKYLKKLLKKGVKVLISGQMDYKLEEKGGKRNLKSNIIANQIRIFDGTI